MVASAPVSLPQAYDFIPPPGAGLSLDPFQERAAHHLEGPIRVLAPAGSGKTRTLTARISRMIAGGIPAGKILALAFNTKAAAEMADRLESLATGGVQTRTFHSLGYEITREIGLGRYDPASEARARKLAESEIRARLPMPDHPGEARRLEARALDVLTRSKSRLTPYTKMAIAHWDTTYELSEAFSAWISGQRARGLLTFSDMIYFALRGLVEDPALRLRWQSRFDFILVDEFQDLNAAQMLLVRILALPQDNLFVVGDDDQLIYAWRDAEERHILEFERMYPQAESVVLATNYRSGVKIVRHGRWLIENNPARVEKDIRPAAASGWGRVDIILEPTAAAQAGAAAAWMQAWMETVDGLDWSDFGLLFRVNEDAKRLEKALYTAGIPFTTARTAGDAPEDPPPDPAPGKATLMTIHRSKGKEFPFVVYFNLSGGGGTALDEADERRVAYVGVTRAGRGLLVTSGLDRPSPFLAEMALNPNFDDFAEPFLQRLLLGARRRALWEQRDWRSWLASFWAWPIQEGEAEAAPAVGLTADRDIDLLSTELRFRRILGIEKKP